ncbi:MAG: DUF4350 domain-containing protein [Chitinophagales bacterium]
MIFEHDCNLLIFGNNSEISDIASMKENRKLNFLVFSLLLLLILMEVMRPKPIDWSTTFSKEDKIPYGNFILFDLLDKILPQQIIETTYQPIYNQLQDTTLLASKHNYLFINWNFGLEELDQEKLLEFVAKGNHVFLATQNFPQKLTDTLNLEIDNTGYYGFLEDKNAPDTMAFNFVHPDLKVDSAYYLKRYIADDYFERFDTLNTIVLGVNGEDEANFIRTTFGEGSFFLHTNPIVFSNYNMTHANNAEYVEKALSHLPLLPTYWDEYYNVGRKELQTPLRYLLNNEALKWALYISLVGLLFFIVFEAKRKQRIIPIIPPVSNTTLDFTKTVGLLYYQHGDHKNLADKKITYFFDYLRNHYFIRNIEYDLEFYQKVASKSGVDLVLVKLLFQKIIDIRTKADVLQEDLLELNKAMDNFYARVKTIDKTNG